MNFTTTEKLQSKTVPGAVVTLRVIGPTRRADIELATIESRDQQYVLQREWVEIGEKLDLMIKELGFDEEGVPLIKKTPSLATPIMSELALRRENLSKRFNLMEQRDVSSKWIEAGVIKIEGYTVDDKKPTVEGLIEYGPEDLFSEVYNRLRKMAYLETDDAKNSQSSITSGSAVKVTEKSTTVPNADANETTSTETAS